MTALEYVKQKMAIVGMTDVLSFLCENREIHRSIKSERRWWNDDFVVASVDGELIGYMEASTTGDDTPYDKGWEFDEDSVCFVERFERVITDYRERKIQVLIETQDG